MLYLLANEGSEETTFGLMEFNNSEGLYNFIKIVDELNSNSSYSCEPVLSVYETDWEYFVGKPEKRKGIWGDSSARGIKYDGKSYITKKYINLYGLMTADKLVNPRKEKAKSNEPADYLKDF